MKKIILASDSKPRKNILKQLGLKFKAIPSRYEEKMDFEKNPKALARKLSLGKAKDVAERHKNAVIIGADTFLVYKNQILGKPKNKKDAFKMLKALNGRCHSIISGVTLIDTKTKKILTRTCETKVYFKILSQKEIISYVNSGEPMGKAGAYAIQGLGAVLVRRVSGDYSNVMGLPITILTDSLKELGVNIL